MIGVSSKSCAGESRCDRDVELVTESLTETRVTPTSLTDGAKSNVDVEIGILTRGKPTLGMVLTSLLLQESITLRIHIVDTSPRPVLSRDDVRFALRLAGDRRIRCSYEFAGESKRAFSSGRARLIRELTGPHLCLCDDDVVLPSIALARLVDVARSGGVYGYICPFCVNAPNLSGDLTARPSCTPGSLIHQDDVLRRILLAYYDSTTDVLDRGTSDEKVWEPAFLTALFESLGRSAIRQSDTVIYHLDYHEGPHWIDDERTVIARSKKVARELAARAASLGALDEGARARAVDRTRVSGNEGSWLERALRAFRIVQ